MITQEDEFACAMEKRREVTSEEYRLAEIMLSLTKAIKVSCSFFSSHISYQTTLLARRSHGSRQI